MIQGPIARRYGHGAARVPLRPVQRRPRPLRTLREGLQEARRDGDAPGRSLASIARALPALVAISVALTWVFAVILTPPPDQSEITIVAFAPPPEPVVPEALPLPEPEPVPLEPEPTPVEPPPQRAEPEPPLPPRPEPPRAQPPPRPEPPPAQPPPRPALPQVARLEPTPPAPAPAPKRVRRDVPPPRQQAAPQLSFDPLATPDPSPPPPASKRTPRFAAASPPDARPRMDAPALRAPPTPDAAQRVTRRSAPVPERSRNATPDLALAAAAPALPGNAPAPRRDARRPAVAPPPRRDSRRQVALAVPEGGPQPGPRPPAPSPSRPRLAPPAPAPAARARAEEPGVRGVALGSLAACVSDRAEDTLKQRVVARVGKLTHCQSPAGRYHFVETKNVNAFLMRIERAPGRKPGDRCEELTFALDCLERH